MTAPDEFLAQIRERLATAPDKNFIGRAAAEMQLLGTDLPRLLAALDGVLALHSIDQHECECGEVHGPYCSECVGESWPCPTVAAVTTALEGQE